MHPYILYDQEINKRALLLPRALISLLCQFSCLFLNCHVFMNYAYSPSLAIAMARVILSLCPLQHLRGIFNFISLVKYVDKSTSFGNTSDFCGTNRTSSKVSPSFFKFIIHSFPPLVVLSPFSLILFVIYLLLIIFNNSY